MERGRDYDAVWLGGDHARPESDARDPGDARGRSRRGFLRTAGVVAATVGAAGCGRVGRYEFHATPVVLPPRRRRQLGYEAVRGDVLATEHTGRAGGGAVVATVETEVRVYESTERRLGGVASVGVASTPAAVVGGRPLNPLADQSLGDLLTSDAGVAFLERAGLRHVGHRRPAVRWARDPEEVTTARGSCLGRRTELRGYVGLLAGEPPSVAAIHVTRVDADSTVVAALVHGHDVEGSDRPLVGSGGYLDAASVEAGTDALGAVVPSLTYATEPARESRESSGFSPDPTGVSR